MFDLDDKKKTVITLPLEGDEIDQFDAAYKQSGFRAKTEFLRHLIFSYIKANA